MKMSFPKTLYFLIICSLSIINAKSQAVVSIYDGNWPAWRGLYNSGAVAAGNTPTEFNETKNIKWKTEIPGKGHATPIVWGDQIIVQTAVSTGKKPEKADTAATKSNPMSPTQAEFLYQFKVISVDKKTGKINWETVVDEELPIERTHELEAGLRTRLALMAKIFMHSLVLADYFVSTLKET